MKVFIAALTISPYRVPGLYYFLFIQDLSDSANAVSNIHSAHLGNPDELLHFANAIQY